MNMPPPHCPPPPGQRPKVTAPGDPGLDLGTELEAKQVAECLGGSREVWAPWWGWDPACLERGGGGAG